MLFVFFVFYAARTPTLELYSPRLIFVLTIFNYLSI